MTEKLCFRCDNIGTHRCPNCSTLYCGDTCAQLDWRQQHSENCAKIKEIGWTVGTFPVRSVAGHTGFGLIHQYWSLVSLEKARKLLFKQGVGEYFELLRRIIQLEDMEDEEELAKTIHRNRGSYVVAGVIWNDIPLIELESTDREYSIEDVKTKVTAEITDRYAYYNPTAWLRGSGDFVTKNYKAKSRWYIIRDSSELDEYRLEPTFSWMTTWLGYQIAQEKNLPSPFTLTQFQREAKKAAELHNNVWLPHHYMAAEIDSNVETPAAVQARTRDIMQFWIFRAISERNPFFLGNILHLVADSFSPSHTKRDTKNPGKVVAIFFYELQSSGHVPNESEGTTFVNPFAEVNDLEYHPQIVPIAEALIEALAFWYWYYFRRVAESISNRNSVRWREALLMRRNLLRKSSAWRPQAVEGKVFQFKDIHTRSKGIVTYEQGAVDYFLTTYCNVDDTLPITTETMELYWDNGPVMDTQPATDEE